jgi:dipeptidyl aminopeptidase/acylaminoacyl peptidase
MDSLDQGANGLGYEYARTGASLVEMNIAETSQQSADLGTFNGTWSQAGKSWLPACRASEECFELRRPQNPVKPYPYREEEVSYSNPAAKIQLAATLTIPPGKGPFPAVLLMVGSGPHDRDETLMGHKPFLVLADYLTRKGIVVLRADKRGVGKSGGDYSRAVMADFASDAEAGVAYLKTRAEVKRHKIGVVGHIEGGIEAMATRMIRMWRLW